MNKLTGKFAEAYKCLSKATSSAYQDPYLVSNQVLSKNPFTNGFLSNFLAGTEKKLHSRYNICKKLINYYYRSVPLFAIYLMEFIEYVISGIRRKALDKERDLILLDTFFVLDRITGENEYRESYLPNLDKVLKDLGRFYLYLPVFSGARRPFRLFHVLRILKKQNVPLITEYQLLHLTDLARMLIFVITYPFHVIRFKNTVVKDRQFGTQLLAFELIETLHNVTFYDYSRYLQGRNIGRLTYNSIKIIGWFENQAIHKNLCKGCKEVNPAILIYGAQLFLYSAAELNVTIDENEKKYFVIPDKILMNGKSYIPEKTNLNYAVGPSLRYSKVFYEIIKPASQDNVLILLPYYENEAINILNIVKAIDLPYVRLLVKIHPANKIEKLIKMVPSGVSIVTDDIYELFKKTKVVISSISGTLLEAASVGVPVISIRIPSRFEYNLFPEHGKGIIWDEVENGDQLKEKIGHMIDTYEDNYQERIRISRDYKEMFYSEPTLNRILEAFDI